MAARDSRGGFTLIEMLAVILLTSLVLGMALNFYVDLSDRGNQASATTRTWRRSLSVVDRIARDLERTYLLVKSPEVDWLSHPWVFLGEGGAFFESGADRIKFPTRQAPQDDTQEPTLDLGYVAYLLQPGEESEGYELLRWSRPGLPSGLDRDLPNPEDMQVVAEGLADFGLQFLEPEGDWSDEWDSSQLRYSNELPTAVKIQLAFMDTDLSTAPKIERRVNLPLRPVDLKAILEDEQALSEDEDSQDDNAELTVGDCILDLDALPEALQVVIENSLDEPFAPFLDTVNEFGSAAANHVDSECL